MTLAPIKGRAQRSANLLHSYFNVFPTVACFRSQLTAEQRWLSHFSLKKQWHQHLATDQALRSLPSKHQRALDLLYNESYQFRPGTPVGKLYEVAEPILGKTHRLLLMNTTLTDLDLLSRLYRNLSKSQLSPQEKIQSFQIGVFVRDLFEDSHSFFYQSFCHFQGEN